MNAANFPPTTKFKAWAIIEAADDSLDQYEDVSAFPVCIGTFDTIEEADAAIIQATGKSSLTGEPA